MGDYSALFEPIKLGPVEVPNRIFQPAYTTGFIRKFSRLPHDKEFFHRLEKAKGGFGLIVQPSEIHPSSDYTPIPMLNVHSRRSIPELKRMAEGIHEYGCKIFLQAWHGGERTPNLGTRLPSMGSSGSPDHVTPHVPKQMDKEDIVNIVGAFGRVSENVREAGWDGVEVHSTHSYLVHQFLSPFYNKRDDEYGGSLENRVRFLLECLEVVRKRVSKEMAVGVRLIADEKFPGGMTPSDSAEIAQVLLDKNLIDYLSLSTGTYHSPRPWIFGPSRIFGEDYQIESIVQVKEELGGEVPVPVLGAGRIKDPDSARKIIEEGKLDMVGLARQSIADPHWPNKVKEDRIGDIMECTGCNKCLAMLDWERNYLGCTQNPTVGEEDKWSPETFDKADEERSILVVGAGPAGMEFAMVAAERGHLVHVNEKERETGGRVRLESKLPDLEEWDRIRDNRERQLEDLANVELHLNAEMDYDSIKEYGAEIVVLATGSKFDRRGTHPLTLSPIAGWDKGHVLIPEDIILDGVETGEKVVVIDEWGYIEGVGIAEHLAKQGKEVALVTSKLYVGDRLLPTVEVFHVWQNLESLGVRKETQSLPLEITDDAVKFLDMLSRNIFSIEAETVVLTTSRMPNNELFRRIRPKLGKLKEETEIEDVVAVGDCVSTRDTIDAVYDGHRMARKI